MGLEIRKIITREELVDKINHHNLVLKCITGLKKEDEINFFESIKESGYTDDYVHSLMDLYFTTSNELADAVNIKDKLKNLHIEIREDDSIEVLRDKIVKNNNFILLLQSTICLLDVTNNHNMKLLKYYEKLYIEMEG